MRWWSIILNHRNHSLYQLLCLLSCCILIIHWFENCLETATLALEMFLLLLVQVRTRHGSRSHRVVSSSPGYNLSPGAGDEIVRRAAIASSLFAGRSLQLRAHWNASSTHGWYHFIRNLARCRSHRFTKKGLKYPEPYVFTTIRVSRLFASTSGFHPSSQVPFGVFAFWGTGITRFPSLSCSHPRCVWRNGCWASLKAQNRWKRQLTFLLPDDGWTKHWRFGCCEYIQCYLHL